MMAVLTEVEIDTEVLTIIARVRGGRTDEARPLIAKKLREGYSSKVFLDLVAEVVEMEPEKGKRGAKRKEPRDFYEIGKRFGELTEDPVQPVTKSEAYKILANEFSVGGEKTIERTVKYYESVMEEINEIEREEGLHSLRAVSP